MPRRQLVDPLQDRPMVGHVAPGHVVLDRERVDLAPQQRIGEQPLELAGEGQRPALEPGQIQRLDPEPVAGEEKLPPIEVVEREGEHAVETAQAIRPPFAPSGKDRLGIPSGAKYSPTGLQFAAQLPKIVDFAVEHDHRAAVVRVHRLRRTCEVDDRQAAMTDADARRGPHSAAVGAPVRHGIGHALDPSGIDRFDRLVMEDPRDPAHARGP